MRVGLRGWFMFAILHDKIVSRFLFGPCVVVFRFFCVLSFVVYRFFCFRHVFASRCLFGFVRFCVSLFCSSVFVSLVLFRPLVCLFCCCSC